MIVLRSISHDVTFCLYFKFDDFVTDHPNATKMKSNIKSFEVAFNQGNCSHVNIDDFDIMYYADNWFLFCVYIVYT